jgi:Putative zinc-finger
MATPSCEEILPQLPDHALGTLPETDVARIRRHLRGCTACRAEAAQLDRGVATFASVVHVADPPPELRDRVMSVLSDEWSETPASARDRRIGWVRQRLAAVAAVVVVVGGLVAWGTASQVRASHLHEDAASYQAFLHALGGRDVRVGEIHPIGNASFDGSVILYDSDEGQSWVLVFAKAQNLGDLKVSVQAADGRSIPVPFPLRFEDDGEGWTGMVTATDLTTYTHVVFVAEDGSVVGTADAKQA